MFRARKLNFPLNLYSFSNFDILFLVNHEQIYHYAEDSYSSSYNVIQYTTIAKGTLT